MNNKELTQLEKRVEFLEASNRSFASTFWKINSLMDSIGERLLSVADKLDKIAESITFPQDPGCKLRAGSDVRKIATDIKRTQDEITTDWCGEDWKETLGILDEQENL